MVVRVAIARSRDDVLAELIEGEIRASSELRLVATGQLPHTNPANRLAAFVENADALIAVGDFAAGLMEEIVEQHAELVVYGIRIGSDTVNVRLKQESAQQLIDTLIALSRGRRREQPRLLEYQLVQDEEACGSCRLVEVLPAHDRVLQATAEWIRQALLAYWQRLPRSDLDVPGHARSPDSLEGILRAPAVDVTCEEVQRAFANLLTTLRKDGRESNEPLARLHHRLGLTDAEFKLVLLALAPEIDINFQIVFGLLNDDLGRKSPTLALACAIVGNPIETRQDIEQAGNLARWRLLDGGASPPQADDLVRLAPHLTSWLLGSTSALLDDPAIRPYVRTEPFAGASLLAGKDSPFPIRDLSRRFLTEKKWIVLPGTNVDQWRARCELAARDGGTRLLRCRTSGLLSLPQSDQHEVAARLARTAHLLGMTPIVDLADEPADENRRALLPHLAEAFAILPLPAVLISGDVECHVGSLDIGAIATPQPFAPAIELPGIYDAAARKAGMSLSPEECQRIALAFPMPLDAIEDAVGLLVLGDARSKPQNDHYELIAGACRRISSPRLGSLANRLSPSFSLDQVILPPEQRAELMEIVGNVMNAPTVLGQWGFAKQLPYGRGVVALFSGPSGTGKTMASQAIARELRTEVFAVDLSRVVSKYIGETEKNLDLVFSEAERANAVLAIQEAESAIGKRGEQKDAHDRYANLEVAYLLQRMESYSGLAILTTNFRQNLDPAFLRRIRFVIEFPKPDARAREAIWKQCLPGTAPVGAGVDFSLLARQIELTGGNIRQITLRAAFAAAREKCAIEMRHIFAATRAELLKLGENGAARDLDEIELFHANDLAA
ncbi:hypothetical protein GCM10027431_26580 [Lysobacter rhizosphaerae]